MRLFILWQWYIAFGGIFGLVKETVNLLMGFYASIEMFPILLKILRTVFDRDFLCSRLAQSAGFSQMERR